jgi:hypothetical protein
MANELANLINQNPALFRLDSTKIPLPLRVVYRQAQNEFQSRVEYLENMQAVKKLVT